MAEKPINLRLRRKQKARDEKRKRSDQATSAAGVTRSQRDAAQKQTRLDQHRIDSHRLASDSENTPSEDD